MFTSNMKTSSLTMVRAIEVLTYATLATIMISQLMHIDGFITYNTTLLVMIGVMLGNLAACMASPLTDLADGLIDQQEEIAAVPAEIRSFISNIIPFKSGNRQQAGKSPSKRAA